MTMMEEIMTRQAMTVVEDKKIMKTMMEDIVTKKKVEAEIMTMLVEEIMLKEQKIMTTMTV